METKKTLFKALLAQFALMIGLTSALVLHNVSVPPYGWKDGSARMDCEFDTESDKLLVVKFYKDGHEFFRYTPNSKPPILTFPLDGVYVDTSQSNMNHVVLKNITLRTGGTFACEVSADRPTFKTLIKQSDMIVVAPPESPPEITGVEEIVSVGDSIRGNCSSFRSKPSASLMFYINGMKADIGDTIEYSPQSDAEGLETSVLGIKFQVEQSHFKSGVMELKCTATIGNGYWVNKKSVSEANINAQPSIPGHNRLSSGAGSEHSHHHHHHLLLGKMSGRGASLILYGLLFSSSCSFGGFLLLPNPQQKQLLLTTLLLLLLLALASTSTSSSSSSSSSPSPSSSIVSMHLPD